MSQQSSEKTKYQVILEEFLKAKEWSDELEIDEEEQTVTLNTGVDLGDQNGRLIIRASDATDVVDFAIYYELKCKETKLDQMRLLLSGIQVRWLFGRFDVFSDGFVRWFHRVDFEGSQPSDLSIQRLIQPGWDAAGLFADAIASVALTKQTAEEALEDHDQARKAEQQASDDEEGPAEL